MPIDWENFDDIVREESNNAREETNRELALEIKSLTTMSEDEINELFPQPADIEKFKELMTIVKSSEDRHIKINQIVSNSEKFSEIVLTLLEKIL